MRAVGNARASVSSSFSVPRPSVTSSSPPHCWHAVPIPQHRCRPSPASSPTARVACCSPPAGAALVLAGAAIGKGLAARAVRAWAVTPHRRLFACAGVAHAAVGGDQALEIFGRCAAPVPSYALDVAAGRDQSLYRPRRGLGVMEAPPSLLGVAAVRILCVNEEGHAAAEHVPPHARRAERLEHRGGVVDVAASAPGGEAEAPSASCWRASHPAAERIVALLFG